MVFRKMANFFEDCSLEMSIAVSGKTIVWDEPNFVFEPQKQIVRSLTDIAVINRIITINKPTGMTQAPADGSSIPADWTGKVIWNTAVPRQVKEINLYDTGMSGVLNVSNLTALERLSCHKNNLTGLTLDNLPALIDLNCRDNQLTGMLDVSHLSKLTGFSCRINQLTGLNVSGLTNLEHLNCSENNLSELLVSSLTALKSLYCDSNDLVSLDVSGRNALTELNCSKNQLTELALHPDAAFKNLLSAITI